MQLESKYNIGEEVWFMLDNEPMFGEIMGINIFIGKRQGTLGGIDVTITAIAQESVSYFIDDIEERIFEKKLFSSREELLSHLGTLNQKV